MANKLPIRGYILDICYGDIYWLNTIAGEEMAICHHTDTCSFNFILLYMDSGTKATSVVTSGHFLASYSIEP